MERRTETQKARILPQKTKAVTFLNAIEQQVCLPAEGILSFFTSTLNLNFNHFSKTTKDKYMTDIIIHIQAA